jgi:hypothetical protein
MSTAAPSTSLNGSASGLSEPQRLISTFVAPTRTFEDLKQRQKCLVPWLVLAICTLASNFIMVQKVDVKNYVRQQIENSRGAEFFEQLPLAQQERQLEFAKKVAIIRSYAAPMLILIVALIVCALLMGAFNFGFRAEVSFPRSFAVMSYSLLPLALNALLVIPVVLFSPDPHLIDFRNPLPSSMAAFFSPTGNKFLYELMGGLDIFRIWIVCLLGLGFQINSANQKIGRTTGIVAVFGIYMLSILARAGLAAML